MKVSTLFFLLALAFSLTANAQITKGNWLVGGDAAFSYGKSKPESIVNNKTFNINISPNIGYFFWDKLAFGTRVDYTFSHSKSDAGKSKFERLLVSPFARYYFLDTDKMVNPFLESSYRIAIVNEANSREILAKAGLAIFVNGSVAYEISLNYLNSTANTEYFGSTAFLLGFGIQVHLKKE